MSGIHKVWTAGRNITIDESMILYSGRAIKWVQYMPAKPIKHGIKVFAACCAYTGILLAYDVYLLWQRHLMGETYYKYQLTCWILLIYSQRAV